MVIFVNWKAVSLVVLTTLFLFGFYFYSIGFQSSQVLSHGRRLMYNGDCQDLEQQVEYLKTLLTVSDQKQKDTLDRMRAQSTETRRKLEVQRDMVKDLERRNRQLIEKMSNLESGGPRKRENDYRLAPHIKPSVLRSLNIHQPSEFEVIPFMSFTKDNLYQLESGMINRPETAPIGDKKRELDEVLDKSLSVLNTDVEAGKQYNEYDLLQGYSRIDRTVGTQYEFYYRTKGKKNNFEHIQLFRPFAPLQNVQVHSYDKRNEWINLIVPLSGRIDTFVKFMEMFVEQCIKKDKRVFLTIVYFGQDGREEMKEILERVSSENHFTHYQLIEKKESFSRGIGLLTGANAWDQGNVLLFFCDVDVYFKDGFLDRCRLNTTPGTRVYYPIVFSMYNPSIVYSDRSRVPSFKDLFIITRDSGFWRTFGFGMTCMYRSDFLFMRGFDTNIQGWGYEDVKLYRKYVKSNIDVVRSPDQGIFHIWHEKTCDPHLQPAQYNMCLASKAIGEASQAQLGMLAFKELKKENEKLHTTFDHEELDEKSLSNDRKGLDDYNLLEINKQFDNDNDL